MAIYIKPNFKPTTIEEIIIELYSWYVVDINTIKSIETYSDEDCNFLQCNSGRYRSIDDVVEIVQTYLPDSKIIDIFKTLSTLVININNVNTILCCVNCYHVNKPTMAFYSDVILQGARRVYVNSKYTWRDFWELLGFDSIHEIYQHQKDLLDEANKRKCKIIKKIN